MKRREFIALCVSSSALAGCLGGSNSDGDGTATGSDSGSGDGGSNSGGNEDGDGNKSGKSGQGSPNPGDFYDVELPISKSELNRGAPKDAIPAITKPKFASDWSKLNIGIQDQRGDYDTKPRLKDEDRIIGVERGGEARAYPLRVLDYHEIVNDNFNGPLLVSFCPLCGSGVTAVRKVKGDETIFGVSGYLWQSDLVMYDEKTGSLWSQILAKSINGEMTGETLKLVPSTLTTWGAWKDDYPDTKVLLPPPKSNTVKGKVSRNYTREAYPGYSESSRIGIGYNDFEDDRLHPKTYVVGVTDPGTGKARAYPLPEVKKAGVINDSVGEKDVVVAVGPGDTLVAYNRNIDGETLEFSDSASSNSMSAGGSQWRITTGKAFNGPFKGDSVERANNRSPMFWFAWADFHPDTEVYRA